MSLIDVKDLSFHYKGSSEPALSHVSLSLNDGQIVGLLGPNGSGKTTFIKVLVGLLKNREGDVLIDEHNVSPYTKSIVSYLPDATYLPEAMMIKDAVDYFADMYKDFERETMNSLLTRMHLNPRLQIKKLSKGNKEKLQLALVLSRRARIYILDEPIGGVDPAAREFILETILSTYAKNALVLISTHLLEDIEPILNRAVFIKNGIIVMDDQVDVLREVHQKSINDLFKEVFKC